MEYIVNIHKSFAVVNYRVANFYIIIICCGSVEIFFKKMLENLFFKIVNIEMNYLIVN